jgi:hypothetical protein
MFEIPKHSTPTNSSTDNHYTLVTDEGCGDTYVEGEYDEHGQ